jgi:xanthine dehydrogenase accessory factor
MNDNEYLVKIITGLLEKGSPLVLASIISLEGSSPRHSGTKMVIDANGKSYGTIGGSLLEATAIKESWAAIASGQSRLMEFALAGKDANDMGMICGGKAGVLLDYISPDEESQAFFKLMKQTMEKGCNFYFLTHFKESRKTTKILGHTILFPDGRAAGSELLTKEDAEYLRTEFHNFSSTSVIELNDTRIVIDPIRKVKTMYCFGAGHVAVPTAHVASLVGFRVIVVDDRPEYASAERFPEAYSVRVISDFNKAIEGLEIDQDSFIVIVTRGHKYDREVLEQALATQAGYIGMISSRRKKAAIYEALLAKGITQAALDRVHSPIGLEIGGETPEEIAISIIAELISVRSRQQQ